MHAIAGLPVAQGTAQVAVQGHAHQIQRREPVGQGRRVAGHIGVEENAQRARVAGRVVSQHLKPGVDLEDVEPVAAEPVVAGVLPDPGQLRMDRHHFHAVFHHGLSGAGGWKVDLHHGLRGYIATGVIAEFPTGHIAGDAQRAHVRHVQHARQAHAPVVGLQPA